MLVKTVTIEELADKGEHECSSWCQDEGFYSETNRVDCVENAGYSTTYTHWGINGQVRRQTRRFWCPDCLPEQFKPFIEVMG